MTPIAAADLVTYSRNWIASTTNLFNLDMSFWRIRIESSIHRNGLDLLHLSNSRPILLAINIGSDQTRLEELLAELDKTGFIGMLETSVPSAIDVKYLVISYDDQRVGNQAILL